MLRDRNSPVHTGLYGPPLAGFAVSGTSRSPYVVEARHGNRAAQTRIVNPSLIRVEPNFGRGRQAAAKLVSPGRSSVAGDGRVRTRAGQRSAKSGGIKLRSSFRRGRWCTVLGVRNKLVTPPGDSVRIRVK